MTNSMQEYSKLTVSRLEALAIGLRDAQKEDVNRKGEWKRWSLLPAKLPRHLDQEGGMLMISPNINADIEAIQGRYEKLCTVSIHSGLDEIGRQRVRSALSRCMTINVMQRDNLSNTISILARYQCIDDYRKAIESTLYTDMNGTSRISIDGNNCVEDLLRKELISKIDDPLIQVASDQLGVFNGNIVSVSPFVRISFTNTGITEWD